LSTLDFQGKQTINALYSQVAANPTSEGLAAFKRSSLEAIEDLVTNAPRDLEGDLRRSLEGSTMSNFYNLYIGWQNKELDNAADKT
jgi:hypothetical protein